MIQHVNPSSEQATGISQMSQAEYSRNHLVTPANHSPGPAPLKAVGNQVVQRLFAKGTSIAKLSVSQPGDSDEQEADRIAEQVVSSAPTGNIHRKCVACEAGGAPCPNCEEEEKLLRKERPSYAPQPTLATHSQIVNLRDGGQLLPPFFRAFFEPRFGRDFSNVRVHTDSLAAESARAIQARAFTAGEDVVFGANEYAPESKEGQKLLAHELAHVAQQRQGPARIARQPNPQFTNPVLTPDEMFQIVVRERAWTFSPGGGNVCVDPAGVGRGVGPAAGGQLAGHSVFAVIQVTDADGRPVALSYGEHISYSDPHAEQRAVTALRREIPALRDVSGGRMTVVVDQTPCPPGRADCMGLLQRFARERGLQLDIHMPTRQSMRGPGPVAPRTAAMSSMRTDVPQVTLNRYYPPGTVPPAGGGGGGGGGLPVVPAAPAPSTGTMRFTPPRIASALVLRQQASLLAQMQAQTQRSIRLTARVQLVARGVSGLLSILSTIGTLRTMHQVGTYGTIFHEAEEQVDHVGEYGREMEQWVEETTDQISLLGAIAAITDADEREDSQALFDIDSSLTDLYMQLSPKADQFKEWAADLRAREKALDILADFFGDMVSVPQGPTTAPNAEALAMHISLQRLSGRMGAAAAHFETAEKQLQFYVDYLTTLAGQANDKAWEIVWTHVAVAVAEAERGRALSESMKYERRLNVIYSELEAIDLELNRPICRPQHEIDSLEQRRQVLMFERDLLRESSTSP
jgi:hypothetical protein